MDRAARLVKVASAIVMATLAAAAGATWWALESGGVAVVRTRAPDGTVRSTHVWYAGRGGELWLEAGAPENSWFRDVRRDPLVSLEIDGQVKTFVAEPIDTPDAHSRIRAWLREKYGIRDRLVGLLVDTSRSVAVRLKPRTEHGTRRPARELPNGSP